MRPLPFRFAVLLTLLGLLQTAHAGNAQSNLGATSSVVNSCVIQTLDSIGFGAYLPTSGMAATGQGQLHLVCTKKAAVSAVPTSGGSQMTGPGGQLGYGLYIDSGLSKVWGSPATLYTNVNFGANATFSNRTLSVSLSQCATLANGLLYAYQPPTTSAAQCFYGQGTGYTLVRVYGTQYNNGLVLNGNLLVAPAKTIYSGTAFDNPTYYATGSLVSGTTYSVATSKSGALALTGTSSGVTSPLALTYYAKVPASQDVSAGTYVDTVTLRVTF